MSARRKRFQFRLSTAIAAMLIAGAALGWSLSYWREQQARREHDALITQLTARHGNYFDAWDFSSEHMLATMPTEFWEQAGEYLAKPGSTQRLVDQIVEHCDDKNTTILLCNVQLMIVMYNLHLSQKFQHQEMTIRVSRIGDFEKAMIAGKFDRICSLWEDIYIRDKLDCVFEMAGVVAPRRRVLN